jgi:hypothetical protein
MRLAVVHLQHEPPIPVLFRVWWNCGKSDNIEASRLLLWRGTKTRCEYGGCGPDLVLTESLLPAQDVDPRRDAPIELAL